MSRFLTAVLLLIVGHFAQAENNPLKTPNVSANALFQYINSNEDTQTTRNGLDIQEAEVAFYSEVDPYSRLTMILTVHPEYTQPGLANIPPDNKVHQEWKVEPEELYADSNEVPNFTFKVGKFYGAFGKHNLLHTHVYPFFDAPLANTTFLSANGLNDPGVSAAYLLPINKWYSEVTVQYFRGEGDNTEFNSDSSDDGVILGHYKNLFDVSDDLTLEVGASAATGRNSVSRTTNLFGLDATFKWRPVSGGLYHSWIAGVEYIGRTVGQPGADDERGDGLTLWGQYQFAERWAALARYEDVEVHNAAQLGNINGTGGLLSDGSTQKYSVAAVFSATEFSSYRIEFDETHGPLSPKPDLGNEHKFVLQANFTIGSHPAHAY